MAAADIKECSVGQRKYEIKSLLGKGGFSEVLYAVDVQTETPVALKFIYKDPNTLKKQYKQSAAEIKAMRNLKHPNVIRLYGYDMNVIAPNGKEAIVLVQQLAIGGELFEFLMYTEVFSQELANSVFHQLIAGLEAIHSMGVAHRDLKPENLIFDENFTLKIADFGFAYRFKKNPNATVTKMETELGTKGYMAPEILNGKKYDKRVDIFAAGVCLFILICGFPPFQAARKEDWWYDKLTKKKYKLFWMAHERSKKFTRIQKSIIQDILAFDPDERLSIAQIKQTPFYKTPIMETKQLKKELKQRKTILLNQRPKKQEVRDLPNILMKELKDEAGKSRISLASMVSNRIRQTLVNAKTKEELTPIFQSLRETNDTKKNQLELLSDILIESLEQSKFLLNIDQVGPALADCWTLDDIGKVVKLSEVLSARLLDTLNETALGDLEHNSNKYPLLEELVKLDEKIPIPKIPASKPLHLWTYVCSNRFGFGTLNLALTEFIDSYYPEDGESKFFEKTMETRLTVPIIEENHFPIEESITGETVDGEVKCDWNVERTLFEMNVSVKLLEQNDTQYLTFQNIGRTRKEFTNTVKLILENTCLQNFDLSHYEVGGNVIE